MKKDIGWLESCFDDEKSYPGGYVKYKIDQLDVVKNLSQELPVRPKFVAEWITKYREKYDLYTALRLLENNTLVWSPIYEWYRMNTHDFVNAFLTGEYEVEEDQKYYALIKGHEILSNNVKYWVCDERYKQTVFINFRNPLSDMFTNKLTKKEWNDLGVNDTNADFVRAEEYK